MMRALVRSALTPVRATPDVRAELVSEELLGSGLAVLERSDEWVRVRGEDNYEGWVHAGGLILRTAREAEAWWDDVGGRPAFVLDAVIADESGRTIVRLPWGARVAMQGARIHLPDGRVGRVAEGRVVEWEELGKQFIQSGAAVISTAEEWMGVPYIWGGRTRWGADCSGLVQSVYRLHGFLLPRDSQQQVEIGEPIDLEGGFADVCPGDLLFFRGSKSPRITHVALSLGGSAILHAAESNGEVMPDDLAGDSEIERSLAGRVVEVRRIFS
jgi:SH3-like domain-containing protein